MEQDNTRTKGEKKTKNGKATLARRCAERLEIVSIHTNNISINIVVIIITSTIITIIFIISSTIAPDTIITIIVVIVFHKANAYTSFWGAAEVQADAYTSFWVAAEVEADAYTSF